MCFGVRSQALVHDRGVQNADFWRTWRLEPS